MSRSYPGKDREEQGYSRQKQRIYRVVRKRAHAMLKRIQDGKHERDDRVVRKRAHAMLKRIQDGKHERDDIVYMHAKSLQSCLTLFNPLDCSPPGSFAHGILQARILEWVAGPFSRGSSQPRDRTWVFLHR